jgi:predicted alpha/beta-fold hydrolase
MAEITRRGWSGAVPHFRGCSGEPNLAPRFYHSGDSGELDWIIRRLHPHATGKFYACGVSLGGNVLLRWLGESQHQAEFVDAACSVSAPLDLAQGGNALSRGLSRLYTRMFLQTLKPKCVAKLQQFPGLFDLDALMAAQDLHSFDNVVTAPLHGYRDADDYWDRASAKHVLTDITVPTLVLNAQGVAPGGAGLSRGRRPCGLCHRPHAGPSGLAAAAHAELPDRRRSDPGMRGLNDG